MTDPIIYRCPAKVNLALSVGPPRDDGFHPIASWMVAVDLYDDLLVEPTDGETTFDIGWADDAPVRSTIDWPIEKDLAYRAHKLLEAEAGRTLPIAVTFRKRIPVGAGLAGGSSNGATMLQTIDELFDLQLPTERLIELSTRLGSDLAFFFTDGSAIVTGLGEQLQPHALDEPIDLCLITPRLHCNTGAVYRMFDCMPVERAADEAAVRKAASGDVRVGGCFNDLAEPACAVEPMLSEARASAAQATGRVVHITGSGAGMFIVAEGDDDARALADRVAGELGIAARAVRTIG